MLTSRGDPNSEFSACRKFWPFKRGSFWIGMKTGKKFQKLLISVDSTRHWTSQNDAKEPAAPTPADS